jgi:hypothetical protein
MKPPIFFPLMATSGGPINRDAQSRFSRNFRLAES